VYKDRIDRNKDNYRVLSTLNKAKKRRKSPVKRTSKLGSSPNQSDDQKIDLKATIIEIGSSAASVSKTIMSSIGNLFGAAVGVELKIQTPMMMLRNTHDAKMLAKKLFLNIASNPNDNIYPKDFIPFFKVSSYLVINKRLQMTRQKLLHYLTRTGTEIFQS